MFYAGALGRPGSNAEFHLVDERLVGHKPRSLSDAEAAALPLTAVTAWETLFDRLDVRRPVPGAAPAILIVGGAGGVGSIAVQLARRLTDLTVIATASRPETAAWVRELGAHHVADHSRPLAGEVAALDVVPFKRKSVSVHWELMFTRSMFETADMGEQGRLLDEVSRLVDAGELKTTLTERLSPIRAATLKRAHAMIESGRTRGKIVIEGF